MSVTFIVCLLSCILLCYETIQYGYSPHTFDGLDVTHYSFHVYTKPQFRITPYCIGMLTAMIWHTKKIHFPTFKLPQYMVTMLISFSVSLIMYYIFGTISAYQRRPCGYLEPTSNKCGSNWSITERAIYNATSKLGWSCSLAIITLICSNSQAMSLQRFLSHSVFFVLSKLTFALYLIHVIVLNIWTFSRTQKYRYSHFEFLMDYFGIVFVSGLCALVVTVLIESPSSALVKMMEKRLLQR